MVYFLVRDLYCSLISCTNISFRGASVSQDILVHLTTDICLLSMCSSEKDPREQGNKSLGDGQTVRGAMEEKTQGNETEVG